MRSQRFVLFTITSLLLLPIILDHPVAAQESISPLPAATEDPKTAELRKQIQGYYDEMSKASTRLDMDGAFKYISPDCKFILRDGMKVNFKTVKDTSKMFYSRATKVEDKYEITQFSTKGDTATVEHKSTTLLRIRNDNGIESDLEVNAQSRDFWMKQKGKWLIKQSRETDRTLKVNGQIVQE
jgi:hypothetical protein